MEESVWEVGESSTLRLFYTLIPDNKIQQWHTRTHTPRQKTRGVLMRCRCQTSVEHTKYLLSSHGLVTSDQHVNGLFFLRAAQIIHSENSCSELSQGYVTLINDKVLLSYLGVLDWADIHLFSKQFTTQIFVLDNKNSLSLVYDKCQNLLKPKFNNLTKKLQANGSYDLLQYCVIWLEGEMFCIFNI